MFRIYKFYIGAAILGIAILVCTGIIEAVVGYQFENSCAVHLNRAATAGSLEVAKSELDLGIKYLKENNITSGNTDIILKRTAYDVGYWYNNIKAARKDLDGLDGTALEKSNALIRLRETLVNHSKNGDSLKAPVGINVYPYTLPFFISDGVGLLFFFGGILCFILTIFYETLSN